MNILSYNLFWDILFIYTQAIRAQMYLFDDSMYGVIDNMSNPLQWIYPGVESDYRETSLAPIVSISHNSMSDVREHYRGELIAMGESLVCSNPKP